MLFIEEKKYFAFNGWGRGAGAWKLCKRTQQQAWRRVKHTFRAF